MNILLTSVGRRAYLVDYFKTALRKSGGGKVYAVNCQATTTGMIAADKSFTVPRVDSVQYVDSVLGVCVSHDVKLVVSLFDIDLPYLAFARQRFMEHGIELVVSDPWVIEAANDKIKTCEELKKMGVRTPRTYTELMVVKEELLSKRLTLPLIVKPRWGMGSIAVHKAESIEELEFFYCYARKQLESCYLSILSKKDLERSVVIQEFIAGEEFGVDVFNSVHGDYLTTVVKQKLEMRSGETDIAISVDNPELVSIGEKLSAWFKHRGNMDVDVLEDESGDLFVLEMNARFGGGYPFSHLAGANFPLALVDMVNGNSPRGITDIQYGVIGLKSLSAIRAKQ